MKPKAVLLAILLILVIPIIAWGVNISGYPKFQAFDSNGDPLSGGKLHTYEPGTTTNKATYSDYQGTTANANPVILDSRGEATIYFDGSYKLVLKDSDDVTIWTIDNFQGTGVSYVSGVSGEILLQGPSGTSEWRTAHRISGNSVYGGDVQSGVSTTREIAGLIPTVNYTSSATPTAKYMHGGFIGNYNAQSEVSVWIIPPLAGWSFVVQNRQNTYDSGGTIYLIFDSGSCVFGMNDYNSGVSVVEVSGTTMETQFTFICDTAPHWLLTGVSGQPGYRNITQW